MLVDFFDYCDKGILTQLVGFNLSFDLNFIRVRSFVNNVKIPPIFLRAEILDLRRIISLVAKIGCFVANNTLRHV